ncbi:HEAT repeat domain-containing protein [Candidatus Venteria ishoeyi]|uniref:HEAT repeat domain-containing protein n=1 Tax=Candidatus Venteria ishoeyi TaxID=1899563 RepID=UPI0025A661E2|nr:HEAT repeat domain-containing protein [Candidatus Venteria ishoeyi]MDM8545387.1 HEAT repeat domain-containing protein [Candidatus Venteria ishoeyi]
MVTIQDQISTRLHQLIQEGDDVDRCYTVRTLGLMQDKSAIPLLTNCLHDEDVDVCIDTVMALADMQDASSAGTLIESLLKDPDGEVKVAAVKALVQLKSVEAIPHLLEVAEHRPENINFESGDWDDWWDIQLEAIKGLGELQVTDAVPVLERILTADEGQDIESEILTALAQIGGEANEVLTRRLQHGSDKQRRRVARALRNSRDKTTFKLMEQTLQDKNHYVRAAGIEALRERRAVQYLPIIFVLFRDEDPQVRSVALKTAQQLIQLMSQAGINNIPDMSAELLGLLHDKDFTVKANVLKALCYQPLKLQGRAEQDFIVLLNECTQSSLCFDALCQFIIKQQLSAAIKKLMIISRETQQNAEVRASALKTLGQLKQWHSAIEHTIYHCMYDDEKLVRLAAIEALTTLDTCFPVGSDLNALLTEAAQAEGIKPAGKLPIDIITDAVEGRLTPPATKKVIPIQNAETQAETSDEVTGKVTGKIAEKTAEKAATDDQEAHTDFVENALEQISDSIKKGEQPQPLSTLDAIAISQVEHQLQQEEGNETQQADEPAEDLEDFLELTEQNRETAKWLFTRDTPDVATDIRRLAARYIHQSKTKTSLQTLLATLNTTEDTILKQEIMNSLTELSELKPQLSAQEVDEIRQQLLDLLNAENRDLRIVATRALAKWGKASDVEVLMQALSDKEVAMQIQVVHTLAELSGLAVDDDEIDYPTIIEQLLQQLKGNKAGTQRAVANVIPGLLRSKPNSISVPTLDTIIDQFIDAGLSGKDGQAQVMSQCLNQIDKDQSSIRLLNKLEQLQTSVERRYVVEMLGMLHQVS